MNGFIITISSCLIGAVIASLDLFSGLFLVIVGGLVGVVITWIELS